MYCGPYSAFRCSHHQPEAHLGEAAPRCARHCGYREPGRCVRHLSTTLRTAGRTQVRLVHRSHPSRWPVHPGYIHQSDPGELFGCLVPITWNLLTCSTYYFWKRLKVYFNIQLVWGYILIPRLKQVLYLTKFKVDLYSNS